jgi:hypothetical protein
MRQAMRLWIKITGYILLWAVMFNMISDAKTTKYLKQDIVVAAHDASLMIDQTQLANGKVIFDKTPTLEQSATYRAFVESLEHNTGLTYVSNNQLEAEGHPFQQDNFRIVSFELIDEENYTFPHQFTHPLYDLEINLSGPTVVAVIETYSPRYFSGEKTLIRRASVYTYKMPQ